MRSPSPFRVPYPKPPWHLYPSLAAPTYPFKSPATNIFRRDFRVLFVQQHPEVVFHPFTTACLWSVGREEMKTLFCGGDDDLHETVIETLHLVYRAPEALRDDYAHTVSGLWATVVDYLEAVSYVF
ncbi:hypothetical protein Y032_0270g846 [Ancylostoma ceylanicum]|uniref:Uncharacterized protein n=1 Tax=Ancylostoma ceylanicum TaxID=53326 RepID=A0A016S9D6_9BILA|nr:hypothetical protein Y032_0270g846 [Ancylostoma ceylanicum]